MAKRGNKQKVPTFKKASPKGKALYAYLFKPDTKFKGQEKFKMDLVLDINDPAVKDYLKAIKEFASEEAPGPGLPYEVDKDAGTAVVSFHTKNAPTVVDADKKPITKEISVGNGSIVRVSASFQPYEGFGGGVTAYLNAVQVIEHVPYVPGVGEFDVEEGFSKDDEEGGDFGSSDEEVSDDDIPF